MKKIMQLKDKKVDHARRMQQNFIVFFYTNVD